VSYGETATKVDINVKGIKTLILEVINIGENDSNLQLDWADARFIVSGEKAYPGSYILPAEHT
jgi:hypothetical protein